MTIRFEGVYPILATPFHDDESPDLESFARMINFMTDIGVDGITVLGVLGESNRMLDHEREALVKAAVSAAAGRMPVIVGVSHPGTNATVQLSQMAQSLGAAAVMIAPSQEAVPSDERVFEYFRRVAQAVSIPIVAQDHPASTHVHMPLPLLLRLVDEIPQIACIKEEAPPTPARIAALIGGMKKRRVPILTGLGALYGLFDLERGSSGFNTGFAFPEALIAMVKATKDGRTDAARRIYSRFLPLIVFEQQPGVAIRKEVLRLRGLIASHRLRHPGTGITSETAQQLKSVIEAVLPGVDITQPIKVDLS
ncbi:MAG TPA: dihydrodipicolinate synthase family protein [Burkholderiales bacterium]|nr:dihydrodipicolinate synthase family protein [Burkholderiales bacterium]